MGALEVATSFLLLPQGLKASSPSWGQKQVDEAELTHAYLAPTLYRLLLHVYPKSNLLLSDSHKDPSSPARLPGQYLESSSDLPAVRYAPKPGSHFQGPPRMRDFLFFFSGRGVVICSDISTTAGLECGRLWSGPINELMLSMYPSSGHGLLVPKGMVSHLTAHPFVIYVVAPSFSTFTLEQLLFSFFLRHQAFPKRRVCLCPCK